MPKIKAKELTIAVAQDARGLIEIAHEAGCSPRTLLRLMHSDGARVRLTTIGKLARALGVDVVQIADFDN